MINTTLTMKGQLDITLFDGQGNVKQSITVPNLVVSSGRNHLAALLAEETPIPMSHMAIGTGNVTPNVADSALQTEIQRSALTAVSRQSNSVTYTATFGSGAAGAVVEAGIFNDPTAGTMLCRSVFGTVTKALDDVLTINWTVSIV